MQGQIPNNQIFSSYFLSIPVFLTSLPIVLGSVSRSNPVLAHNVKTNVDVGVTFHIEPDHSPQTGQESQAWFALTRKGGELIPLAQCDCELNVYLESNRDSSAEALLSPQLISLSPEKYQNIPGANLIFPKPGIYQLELTGNPKEAGDFTPFQVSYPVTVKAGNSKLKQSQAISLESKAATQVAEQTASKVADQVAQSSSEQTNLQQETNPNLSVIIPLLIGILVISIGLIKLWKLFTDSKEGS